MTDYLRVFLCAECFVGFIALIPFKGISRLHPMLWPAMMLFAFYDIVVLIGQVTLWGTPFTIRLFLTLILTTLVLLWALVMARIAGGKKTKIWPFNWSVQAYDSPTNVWKGDKHIYRPGEYNSNGVDDG